MKKIVMILLMMISFVGCFNEDKKSFTDYAKDSAIELAKLQDIQNTLTIDAKDYREMYIDDLNNVLKLHNLKTIEIKKYNDEQDVLNSVKTINSDNPNIKEFLSEYDKHGNNHLLSVDGNVEISLIKDKYGDYYKRLDYKDSYYNEATVIDKINVPINRILSTDGVIYTPSLEKCKEFEDETHFYIWGYKLSVFLIVTLIVICMFMLPTIFLMLFHC